MSKKATTSAALAAQIEALQKQLAETKRAEAEAADQELLRLAHKAGLRDEFIRLARERIGPQRGGPNRVPLNKTGDVA